MLAEAKCYDAMWEIGYRADHKDVLCPNRVVWPQPVGKKPCRLCASASTTALCRRCATTILLPFEAVCPRNVGITFLRLTYPFNSFCRLVTRLLHGGDVLSVTTAAGHMEQGAQPRAKLGSCLVPGIVSMDHSSFATKIRIRRSVTFAQFGCVALLDTGSPQSFIIRNAWEHMVRSGAATTVCEAQTPSRSWRVASLADFHHCPFEHSVLAQRPTDRVTSGLDVHRPLRGHAARCPPRP